MRPRGECAGLLAKMLVDDVNRCCLHESADALFFRSIRDVSMLDSGEAQDVAQEQHNGEAAGVFGFVCTRFVLG